MTTHAAPMGAPRAGGFSQGGNAVMTTIDPGLDALFRHAIYRVYRDDVRHDLRIDTDTPAVLADWCRRYAPGGTAWIITACNPAAAQVSTEENAARQRVLADLLDRPGWHRLVSCNCDPDQRWPSEPGWLVAGPEESAMRALGRRCGQAAIVAVSPADVSLVWLNP